MLFVLCMSTCCLLGRPLSGLAELANAASHPTIGATAFGVPLQEAAVPLAYLVDFGAGGLACARWRGPAVETNSA